MPEITLTGYSKYRQLQFTSTGAWTPPRGAIVGTVHCYGGGGGGGSSADDAGGAGGGGGGGAYARKAVTMDGTSISYSVGNGGFGGDFGGGDPGEDSHWVNASTCMAKGGGGGGYGLNGSLGSGGSSVNSVGDTKYAGGDGADGVQSTESGGGGGGAGNNAVGGNATGINQGTAGSDDWLLPGDGGDGRSTGGTANSGNQYGGGGGGGYTSNTSDRPGGFGAQGIVVMNYLTTHLMFM